MGGLGDMLNSAQESVTGAFNTASTHASNLFGKKKEEDQQLPGTALAAAPVAGMPEPTTAPTPAPSAGGRRRRRTKRRGRKAKRTMHRRKGKKSAKRGKKSAKHGKKHMRRGGGYKDSMSYHHKMDGSLHKKSAKRSHGKKKSKHGKTHRRR